MTGTTAFDVEPEGHPERLIDAMRDGGRSDVEIRSLLRTARDGIGTLGSTSVRRERHSPQWGPIALAVPFAVALLVVVRIAMPSVGHTGSARIRDATSFFRSEANVVSGRYLVVAVPIGVNDPRAEAGAMERSQRDALQAAQRCVGGGSPTDLGSSDIVGPSAGLILALTLVDRFHELDHQTRVAGTGTISADGEVGPVGAVAQKAAAAEAAKADIFLMPADQRDEAARAVDRLPVAGVRSLDEALRILTGSGCSG